MTADAAKKAEADAKWQRLADNIRKVAKNSNIKLSTKKGMEFEQAILFGVILSADMRNEQPEPYLSILAMSGRQLTNEYREVL